MGLDVILEGENHIQAGPRPKIVHPSDGSRSKIDERDIKGLLRSKYYNLRKLDGDTQELRLSNSSSPRRKSMPARTHVVYAKDGDVVKRGSVYQSSKEVRRMRQVREGRGKAERDLSDEAFLSFDVVDTSSQPLASEAIVPPKQKRSPLASLNMESTSQSVDNDLSVPRKSTGLAQPKYTDFLELSFRDLPEECLKLGSPCPDLAPPRDSLKDSLVEICLHTNELEGKRSTEARKTDRKQKVCTKADANNVLSEREAIYNLPKSFSARAVMFSSPCQSERENLKASQKSRFSTFKRMLDPIMKSKSQRNPSLMETETVSNNAIHPNISSHRVLRKSLLNDFSKATHKVDNDSGSIERDRLALTVSSPAHLHAILKLECKHGAPSYEFSVDNPEDTISAKTWRSDSAFNWVYTFHSSKKKTSIGGRGSKERHGQSPPIIGQMQVSCYLCSEVSDSGVLDNSTVTEFILYDIAQARRSSAVEEGPHYPSDPTRPPTFTIADSLTMESPCEANSPLEPEKGQHRCRRPSSDFDSDPSTSYPWAPADLHPHLEIAAIVTQIPFNKKERKGRQVREEIRVKEQQSLLSASAQETDTMGDGMSPAHVKVVTPSGTHGLPSTEESGPSSLLDRWRFGGGCDCGGWDMACPIVVFDNPYANDVANDSGMQSQQPIVLFVQGRKEKIPALSIMADGKGQYSVHFHAQLSALQAFSICIAILHGSEGASALGQDDKHTLYSNSLKLLLEEEVKHLIEAVEEKRKSKKKDEQIPPSFVLNPPFSPMGRV